MKKFKSLTSLVLAFTFLFGISLSACTGSSTSSDEAEETPVENAAEEAPAEGAEHPTDSTGAAEHPTDTTGN